MHMVSFFLFRSQRHQLVCNTFSTRQTFEEAMERYAALDPWQQHRAVKQMYSWKAVRQRTESVYHKVAEVRWWRSAYSEGSLTGAWRGIARVVNIMCAHRSRRMARTC